MSHRPLNELGTQSEYWDRAADEKEFTHPLVLEKLTPLLTPDARILDFGCGYGRITHELWAAGYSNVVGSDSSPKMIERGKKLFPHLDLRVASGGFPFDDGTFDALLLFAVLTCIPHEPDQDRLLKEVERVLAPGGVLYVSDLLLQDDERNRRRYVEGEAEFGATGVFELPEGAIVCHMQEERVQSLTASFETLRMDALDILTMNGNPARAYQYIGRLRVG